MAVAKRFQLMRISQKNAWFPLHSKIKAVSVVTHQNKVSSHHNLNAPSVENQHWKNAL